LYRYGRLVETDSADPSVRTTLNVRESDATLIVSHGPLQGGSPLTLEEARKRGKPVPHVDFAAASENAAASQVCDWLQRVDPHILNVAGPRASQDPATYRAVVELLHAALTQLAN
jgi:hypothetical protein